MSPTVPKILSSSLQKAKVKKIEEHGDEDDTCLVNQLRVRQLDPLPSQENERMIIEGGYRTVLS